MPKPQQRRKSDRRRDQLRVQNAELREQFEKLENWFALQTAIRATLTVPPAIAPFPIKGREYMSFVPDWVLDACHDLVTSQIRLASKGRGWNAKWFKRYCNALKDDGRWALVSWCRKQGLSESDAIIAASDWSGESDNTIAHALQRIRDRREKRGLPLRTFRPSSYPWQDDDPSNDPVFKQIYEAGGWEGSVADEHHDRMFTATIRLLAKQYRDRIARGERVRDDDSGARAERLVEFIEQQRPRTRRRRTR